MPGDIVTSMNGLPVGTDGTFKDYCDVIRTAGEGAPISVEVLRFDTSEVLQGRDQRRPADRAGLLLRRGGRRRGRRRLRRRRRRLHVRVGDRRHRSDLRRRPDGVGRPGHGARHAGGRHARCRTSPPRPTSTAFLNGFDVPGLIFAKLPAPVTSTPRWPSTASPAAAPTAGSPTTPTRCSPASTRCGRTAAARRPTSSRWSPCRPTARYTAVMQAQIVTDADLVALDQAFDTFNSVS